MIFNIVFPTVWSIFILDLPLFYKNVLLQDSEKDSESISQFTYQNFKCSLHCMPRISKTRLLVFPLKNSVCKFLPLKLILCESLFENQIYLKRFVFEMWSTKLFALRQSFMQNFLDTLDLIKHASHCEVVQSPLTHKKTFVFMFVHRHIP